MAIKIHAASKSIEHAKAVNNPQIIPRIHLMIAYWIESIISSVAFLGSSAL